MARGQSVGQHSRQRRLGDDGELGASGKRSADERREHERQGRLGPEWIDAGGRQAVEQPRPEASASEVVPQNTLGQFEGFRRARLEIDDAGNPEVARRRLLAERRHFEGHPPASALTNETMSPVESGSSGSRLIWSPFKAATTCDSSMTPIVSAASP